MKTSRVREIESLVSRAGLVLECAEIGGSGHIRAAVRGPDGGVHTLTFSSTPRDRRGDLNKAAMLRRIAAGRSWRYG